jgi:putative ABC transport system permease protein
MDFLKIAINNIKRHKTRSILTIFGIATSVAVLFSILSFNKGFSKGLSRELERTGIHFMIVPSGCPHEVASLVLHGSVIPKFLDVSVIDKRNLMDKIEFASPILVAQLPNIEKGRVELVYGIEMSRLSLIKPHWEIEGTLPLREDEIVLGAEIAGHQRVKIGDTLRYSNTDKPFRVTGILKRTGSQDDAFIYMDIKTAQSIFKKPSGATAIGVKVKNHALISKISDELSEKVPGIQIVTMNQVMNSISNLASSAKILSLSIAFIAIIVSAVGVMNSMLTAVFERTQEIGMMRAIGASRLDIFRIIMKEGLLITISGGIIGIIISVAGNDIIETLVRKFMPYVPGGDMVSFDLGIALLSISFTSVIGIVSGLYPAWKASKINPIEAIKG